MTPETTSRLRDLLTTAEKNGLRSVSVPIGQLASLLTAADLKGSAEICNGDLIAQRDHAIEEMEATARLIEVIAAMIDTFNARKGLQVREISGAPGA